MKQEGIWRLGVVEGFFGRPWSWEARADYAHFLKSNAFNSYIYAPKSDTYLRKQWFEPFPTQHVDALIKLSQVYQAQDLDFGIGLSPYELYLDFSTKRKEQLRNKVEAINATGCTTLCLLFDDMIGDLSNLASQQVRIMDFVMQHSTAKHFVLCPTYYSSDPRLIKLFGTPPDDYLKELGKTLDSSVDIFWTGQSIISTEYPHEHLQQIADEMQRKPLLWDNYPVNDASYLCTFLHLQAFKHNGADLRELCAGHLANPMNQAYLSQIALFTLAKLYENPNATKEGLFKQACSALCSGEMQKALQMDADKFQNKGLKLMSAEQIESLTAKYQSMDQHPMAQEIVDWLQGEYAFDPACLS